MERILLFLLKKAKGNCVPSYRVTSASTPCSLISPFMTEPGLSICQRLVSDRSIILYCAQSLLGNRTKALNSSAAHKVRLPTGVLSFSGTVRHPILPLDKWLGKLIGTFPEHSPRLYKGNQLASTGLPGRAPMWKQQTPTSTDVRY